MAEVPISGSVDPATFPYLLVNLHQQGATGSLKVNGPSYQKALYFRGGRVLFGSSNDPRDQLGAILIESGKLTPEQLEDSNARVGPGNPLAKVLADSGAVNPRELGEAAKAKVERILADVIAYDDGSFEFEDDVLPKGAIDLKLSTERLFVSALRRLADRAFVLRHLGGGDRVLRPTASGPRLDEVRGEAGPLLEALDGAASLREVAARVGLGESEAMRVACGLLLLGLVQKVDPHAEPGAPALPVVTADGETDLDLEAPAPAPFDAATADGPPSAGSDEPFFLDGGGATMIPPPSRPPFVTEREPEAEPFQADEPIDETLRLDSSPFAPTFPPTPPPVMPPPESPAVAATVTPPKPERTRGELPLVPPPRPVRSPRTPQLSAPETEPTLVPPPPAPRPSKADLAALDDLLNSRGLESPLRGATKHVPKPAWEPRFGQAAAGRKGTHPPSRSTPVWIGLALLVAAAGGVAAWYFLLRPLPPRPASLQPTPLPKAASSPADVATPPISPSPEAGSTAPPATASTPVATPSAKAASGGGSPAEARAALQRGDLAAAGREFTATLRAAPRGAFSIQILVACSADTVFKALQSAPAPELFVLPVNYKGRDCHRLCWGTYDSRERAQSAIHSVPAYFREGGASPKVVAASEILP